jgi:hypothetical protein
MQPTTHEPVPPDPDPTPDVEALSDHPTAGRPASLAAAVEPLLVDTAQAARICGISPATWFRFKARGMTPAPVKLAGRVLYRVEDLRLWVRWDCCSRKELETRKAAQRNSRPG